jgi:hypothetical protein
MLQKIHGTNFFHIKLLDRQNQNQLLKWTSAAPSSGFFILMVRLYISTRVRAVSVYR